MDPTEDISLWSDLRKQTSFYGRVLREKSSTLAASVWRLHVRHRINWTHNPLISLAVSTLVKGRLLKISHVVCHGRCMQSWKDQLSSCCLIWSLHCADLYHSTLFVVSFFLFNLMCMCLFLLTIWQYNVMWFCLLLFAPTLVDAW